MRLDLLSRHPLDDEISPRPASPYSQAVPPLVSGGTPFERINWADESETSSSFQDAQSTWSQEDTYFHARTDEELSSSSSPLHPSSRRGKQKLKNRTLRREELFGSSAGSSCSENAQNASARDCFYSVSDHQSDSLYSSEELDDVNLNTSRVRSQVLESPSLAAGLPSIGSENHANKSCQPCMLVHSWFGCSDGRTCRFCHFPHSRRNRPCKAKRERIRKMLDQRHQAEDDTGSS